LNCPESLNKHFQPPLGSFPNYLYAHTFYEALPQLLISFPEAPAVHFLFVFDWILPG